MKVHVFHRMTIDMLNPSKTSNNNYGLSELVQAVDDIDDSASKIKDFYELWDRRYQLVSTAISEWEEHFREVGCVVVATGEKMKMQDVKKSAHLEKLFLLIERFDLALIRIDYLSSNGFLSKKQSREAKYHLKRILMGVLRFPIDPSDSIGKQYYKSFVPKMSISAKANK